MHEVLTQINAILKPDLVDGFNVKRIVTGTWKAAFRSLLTNTDLPAVIIVPGKQRNENSQIANNLAVIFPVDFYIVSRVVYIKEAIVNDITANQQKTIYEIANETMKIFAGNKDLNGVVRRWSKKWDTQLLELRESDGIIVLRIATEWINDLVPWPSSINNQSSIPINTELRHVEIL